MYIIRRTGNDLKCTYLYQAGVMYIVIIRFFKWETIKALVPTHTINLIIKINDGHILAVLFQKYLVKKLD